MHWQHIQCTPLNVAVVTQEVRHCINLFLAGQKDNHVSFGPLLFDVSNCLESLEHIIFGGFAQVEDLDRIYPPCNVNDLHL